MNRKLAPAYEQAQNLQLISPEKIELSNGTIIFWMRDVKDVSVKLDVEWNAGSKFQSKKLVASFANKLLLSGSENHTAKQIAEEVDFFGGYTQLEIDKDHAGCVIYGLTDNFKGIFNCFTKAFENCEFPASEFAKQRDISLNKFKVESQKVKDLCRKTFTQNLYGPESSYGQVAEESDFHALQREDLQVYFKEFYAFAPILFLTGNVSDDMIDLIKSWALSFAPAPKVAFSQAFNQTKGRIVKEKKDALQAAIRIGRMMFDKNHKDYYHFQVLNTILGGYFGSRLMTNIREDKGYTYGIGSGMAVLQDAGYFFISTEVGADVKEKALEEIFIELDKLKNELVADDELTKVKNYMLGEFLRQADGPIAMMETFKNIYFNDLKDTYYSDFIQAIQACTSLDLKDLAERYFVKEEMLVVIAG